jgi:hypothetical protein
MIIQIYNFKIFIRKYISIKFVYTFIFVIGMDNSYLILYMDRHNVIILFINNTCNFKLVILLSLFHE